MPFSWRGRGRKGFTAMEILIVLLGAALLLTLAFVSLNVMKRKSRDARRVTDIKSIQSGLELYRRENGFYPVSITLGDPLLAPSGEQTYIAKLPHNPTPWDEENCPPSDYVYSYLGPTKYIIDFCLAYGADFLPKGRLTAGPEGIAPKPIEYAWFPVGSGHLPGGDIDDVSLALGPDGTPFVAYLHDGGQLRVMTWKNNAWEEVGGEAPTDHHAQYISLKVDGSGRPFVAFTDIDNSSRGSVMFFTDGHWRQAGSSNFNDLARALYSSLELDSNGAPYVAFADGYRGMELTVKRLVGNNWLAVGNTGFSSGKISEIDLAMGPADQPAVVYKQTPAYGNLYAKRYDEATQAWIDESPTAPGEPNFYSSMVIDSAGAPILAYRNADDGDKTYVKKLVDGNWQQMGEAASPGAVLYNTLALSPDDTPFLAYSDSANDNRLTVKRYSDGSWQAVGDTYLTDSKSEFNSMAIGPDGLPIIAFRDHSSGEVMVIKLDLK